MLIVNLVILGSRGQAVNSQMANDKGGALFQFRCVTMAGF